MYLPSLPWCSLSMWPRVSSSAFVPQLCHFSTVWPWLNYSFPRGKSQHNRCFRIFEELIEKSIMAFYIKQSTVRNYYHCGACTVLDSNMAKSEKRSGSPWPRRVQRSCIERRSWVGSLRRALNSLGVEKGNVQERSRAQAKVSGVVSIGLQHQCRRWSQGAPPVQEVKDPGLVVATGTGKGQVWVRRDVAYEKVAGVGDRFTRDKWQEEGETLLRVWAQNVTGRWRVTEMGKAGRSAGRR